MDFINSFKICGAGLEVQRVKLDTAIENIANVNTTRTPEGGPYKRKTAVIEAKRMEGAFNSVLKEELRLAKIAGVISDDRAVKMIYDPAHPDANEKGFVALPDINLFLEMMDMITVNRSYEAVTAAFDATKQMAMKSLEMGR